MATKPPPPPTEFKASESHLWEQAVDERGQDYYYHVETGYVTRDNPRKQEVPQETDPQDMQLHDGPLRFFVQEFTGCFVSQSLCCGIMWALVKLTTNALQTDRPHNGIPAFLSPVQEGNQTLYYPQGADQSTQFFIDRTGMYQNTAFFLFLFSSIGIGLSFAVGIGVSLSGQLNPVFSFALALLGVLEWKNVLPCILGQILGDCAGCAAFYSMIISQTRPSQWVHGLMDFKTMEFAQVFYVIPRDSLSGDLTNGHAFWNSVFASSSLVMVIIPVFASKQKLHRAIEPLIIGMIVTVFVMGTFGLGVVQNPAQYLGGTLFCWMAGWPADEIWSHDDYFIFTAMFAPMIGAVFACFGLNVYFILLYSDPSLWLDKVTSVVKAGWRGLTRGRPERLGIDSGSNLIER